jgi:phosphatidylglycerophosphate synthase
MSRVLVTIAPVAAINTTKTAAAGRWKVEVRLATEVTRSKGCSIGEGNTGRQFSLMRSKSLLAASASLGAFGLFTAVAAARLEPSGQLLTPANVLSFSRAGAASWLCGYAASPRSGAHRAAAWLILLWGATATDWLDGPLARRTGPTALGAVLDLEADSWLTLSAAAAAWRSSSLPAWCLVPPALRYVVRAQCGLTSPMATAGWQKAAGVSQMVVLSGALAPSRTVRSLARWLCQGAVLAQLVALAADWRRSTSSPRAATAA